MATSSNGSTTGREAYTIDSFGRLVEVDRTGANAGTTTYGYDRLDRLTSVTQPVGPVVDLLDAAGIDYTFISNSVSAPP
jgi:YD repeat-containing protein